MAETRIGILGTWLKLEKFAGMVNETEGCSVVAVWDTEFENARQAAEKLGCKAVQDVDDILNDPEIDGVMILTEYYLHTELLSRAAAAGKHILVEKPLCTSLEDAYTIQKLVKESGIKFYMSEPFVSATTIFQKQLMESGKLGKILSARAVFGNLPHPHDEEFERELTRKTGGGMMSDLGTHVLHSVYYLFGIPEKIYAHFYYSSEFTREIGKEEYVTMLMEYPDGVTVSLQCSTISPGFTNRLEVTGTDGIVVNTGLFRHDRTVKYQLVGDDADGWTIPDDSEIPADPTRHVYYWLRMIKEDISQEEFEQDPLGNCGLSIDRAVDLVKIRDMIYKAAAEDAAASAN